MDGRPVSGNLDQSREGLSFEKPVGSYESYQNLTETYPPPQPGLKSFNFLSPASQNRHNNDSEISVPIHPRQRYDPPYLPPSLPGRRSTWNAVLRISFFFILPIVIAGIHHAVYASKDGKVPGVSTITVAGRQIDDQMRLIFIGTLLVFISKSFTILSLLTSYDQVLWRTVRLSRLRLRGLDALFSIPNDPLAFFHFDLWSRAKFATLIGLIAWLLPISFLIIPGTLSVVSAPTTAITSTVVPTISVDDQDQYLALATLNPQRAYISPALLSRSIAARALTGGSIPTSSSPCGPSCSYNLSFTGPSFSCTQASTSDLTSNQSVLRFSAFQNITTLQDIFTVHWLKDTSDRTGFMTTCTPWVTDYTVGVTWEGGSQSVDVVSTVQKMTFGTASPLTTWGASEVAGIGDGNPSGLAVMAALKDSVTELLTGSIIFSSQTGLTTTDTLALFSTLPSLNLTSTTNGDGALLTFDSVPNKLQDILLNTTLGLMAYPLFSTTLNATVTTDRNVFKYDSHALWAGYGTAFGVNLLIALIGLISVLENGGSGNRSFTMVAATTRNRELDGILAEENQDEDGVDERKIFQDGKEKGNVRLRYREVERVDRGFEEGVRVKWAFGT